MTVEQCIVEKRMVDGQPMHVIVRRERLRCEVLGPADNPRTRQSDQRLTRVRILDPMAGRAAGLETTVPTAKLSDR